MRLFSRWRKNPDKENGHLSEKVAEGTRILLPEFNLDDLIVKPGSIDRTKSLTAMAIQLEKIATGVDKKNGDPIDKEAEMARLATIIASFVKSNYQQIDKTNLNTNRQIDIDVPAESLPITAKIDLVESGENDLIHLPFEITISRNPLGPILEIRYVGSNSGTQFTGKGTGIKEEQMQWIDSRHTQ